MARLLGLASLVVALLPACGAPSAKPPWLPYTPASSRPVDPWVVRCVLDGRPRMLVVALDRDLWAAWDTQSCTLAKTWRGDVNFDGPVYTTAHGPQPTSRGDELPDPTVGLAWTVQRHGDTAPGNVPFDPAPAAVSYLGHRIVDGHVQMHFALVCPDGERIDVTETIEAIHPNTGGVELVRQFDFDRWPGWRPMLLGPLRGADRSDDRRPAEYSATGDEGSGVQLTSWMQLCDTFTWHDVLHFTEQRATFHMRHDIDLHVPPRGVPAPGVVAGSP